MMPSLSTPGLNDVLRPEARPPLISSDRVRVIIRCLVGHWLVIAAAGYVWDLLHQTKEKLTNGAGRPFGDDFINYWSGAWLAWHGRASEIYDFSAFHAFQQALV